jgi:hypothetical protein
MKLFHGLPLARAAMLPDDYEFRRDPCHKLCGGERLALAAIDPHPRKPPTCGVTAAAHFSSHSRREP